MKIKVSTLLQSLGCNYLALICISIVCAVFSNLMLDVRNKTYIVIEKIEKVASDDLGGVLQRVTDINEIISNYFWVFTLSSVVLLILSMFRKETGFAPKIIGVILVLIVLTFFPFVRTFS